jgi:hypothetical protein
MKPRNPEELRSAIERYEVLYLNVQNYGLKQQVWQTLVYLREMLKSNKRRKRSKA